MKSSMSESTLSRREFVRGGSLATLMTMMGGVPLRAEETSAAGEPTAYQGLIQPLNCAVIGRGVWGRDILKTLARIPAAPVVALCDPYAPWLSRAQKEAPKAAKHTDYREVLERKDVQAVIVATPSHLRRPVVIEALEAGKHVYCEAPLAASLEDARAIAHAAKETYRLNFQTGLQSRSDPQLGYLCNFLRSGALGRPLKGHSQAHKRQSWRRAASENPERERALNWRLSRATSPGLVGEVGVHRLDIANWFFRAPPVAVTGHGAVLEWNDGRDVPDTVHAQFEYPGGVLFTFDATLANSFDADHDLYYGTHCAILMRERRAWMFKEADAPVLGWEVYARKDAFYKDSGIVLGAGYSKQEAQGGKPTFDPLANDETPLHYALTSFLVNSNQTQEGVQNFAAAYDASDTAALKEYLAGLSKARRPAAGWQEGYLATLAVLKANEAILTGSRVVFKPEWLEV